MEIIVTNYKCNYEKRKISWDYVLIKRRSPGGYVDEKGILHNCEDSNMLSLKEFQKRLNNDIIGHVRNIRKSELTSPVIDYDVFKDLSAKVTFESVAYLDTITAVDCKEGVVRLNESGFSTPVNERVIMVLNPNYNYFSKQVEILAKRIALVGMFSVYSIAANGWNKLYIYYKLVFNPMHYFRYYKSLLQVGALSRLLCRYYLKKFKDS
jgi:hypothetical protein